ncbi:MAG: Ig-like domain-containing protein [Candidatus Magasanikbacteria bacterium]|nr:Ig-like domain-containing protein [Candidatus Magasanikbacteria bacterium]
MLPWILQQFNQKKKTAITLGVCLVAVFFVWNFLPLVAKAQSTPSSQSGADVTFGLQPIADTTVLSSVDIRVIIARIINVALGLLGVVVFVIVLYAGYTIMTAGGNEEKVAEGKKILVNAVIGLAIILSAYAIVSFIIRALSNATGTGNVPSAVSGIPRQNFSASGALGTIIRDHYPLRDQADVPRNSRISVTFREPIDPSTLIINNPSTDINGTTIYGDCRVPGSGQVINWEADCDQLNTDAVRIYPTGDSPNPIRAAVIAVPEGTSQQYFTFVFVPLAPIGSETATMNYTVDLTNRIQKSDGNNTSAFVGDRDGHYVWNFDSATNFDFSPPTITSVYPNSNSRNVARNTVVQIRFSEAMDPSTVQGLHSPSSDFTNIIFGNAIVTGNWRVTNGYSTVEFASDVPCGQLNSCGEVMYCLPPSFDAMVLARTAQLLNCPANQQNCLATNQTGQPGQANSFAGVPLTGITDMAGNVLDGNGQIGQTTNGIGLPEGKPAVSNNPHTFSPGEQLADNAFWNFSVGDNIDLRAPIISNVEPSVDAERVAGTAPVVITFSDRIWEQSLDNVLLEEHGLDRPLPFWFRIHSVVDNNRSVVTVDHREFGPNGEDAYYYPSIPSTVKNLNQNCLYPGRGPSSAGASCFYNVDSNNNPILDTGCVPVNSNPNTDTGCPNTASINPAEPDIATCRSELQAVE